MEISKLYPKLEWVEGEENEEEKISKTFMFWDYDCCK